MAEPTAELRAAISEALTDSQYPTDESTADDSWDEWEATDQAGEADPAEDTLSKGEPDEEAVVAEEETPAADVPTEYWGVALDGIPEEQARAILDKFQQQDSYIHRLQDRLSKEPETPDSPAGGADVAPEVEEEVTDEALLMAMGLDPESYETQQLAPVVLPLARTVLDLESKVETMATRDATREVETAWNRDLDNLEQTYGKLPVDRLQMLQFAVEEGIASPFETYWRIKAPAELEVRGAVDEARRLAAKQAQSGGVKPRNTSGGEPTGISKDMSLRDAVKVAMKESEKETGLSFKGLFSGRKVKTD